MWAVESYSLETESVLCHLLALWCLANYQATQNLSFLICKWDNNCYFLGISPRVEAPEREGFLSVLLSVSSTPEQCLHVVGSQHVCVECTNLGLL